MKIFKNNAWLGLLALALVVCVAGCDSDPVAPDDKLPQTTAGGSAATSAAIARIMTEVGPIILDPSKAVVDIDLDDPGNDYEDLSGSFRIDYRDGPDGNPAEPGAAAWAHAYTDEGSPVVVTLGDTGGSASFEFDVTGNISRSPDTLEILAGSNGTMVSGERTTTFTADGVVIDGTDYPASGTVTVTPGDGGPESTVTFNGTNMVMAVVEGVFYEVDLDTGSVTEMMPVK